MTSQKTITSLSIAAIALLAAAVPSFAQAQSDLEAQSSVATQASEQTIVSSTELIAVSNVRVATPAIVRVEQAPVANTSASPLRFSPSAFLSASSFKVQNNFTSATGSRFDRPQVSFSSPVDPTAKKQFRADVDEPTSAGKLSFVPSRGPKLPDTVVP